MPGGLDLLEELRSMTIKLRFTRRQMKKRLVRQIIWSHLAAGFTVVVEHPKRRSR